MHNVTLFIPRFAYGLTIAGIGDVSLSHCACCLIPAE